MRKIQIVCVVVLLLSWFESHRLTAQPKGFQELMYERTAQLTWSVLPLWCVSESSANKTGVVGTGFFINEQGYFITAAHVANVNHLGTIPCFLQVMVRTQRGDASPRLFDVIETDADHDLALCQIKGLLVRDEKHSPILHGAPATFTRSPFASLAIDTETPRPGELVALDGFPLGSWVPDVQLGNVAAVLTLIDVPRTPKDGRELLQVSVNGNHGDSGGPVVDMTSGRVIGVLLEILPAPLATGGELKYDLGNYQSSGIMLAAPAKWVNALLAKHQVSSSEVKAGKFFAW
jgi:S1-C subfamily serine protease